jgi:hypothetical protein
VRRLVALLAVALVAVGCGSTRVVTTTVTRTVTVTPGVPTAVERGRAAVQGAAAGA